MFKKMSPTLTPWNLRSLHAGVRADRGEIPARAAQELERTVADARSLASAGFANEGHDRLQMRMCWVQMGVRRAWTEQLLARYQAALESFRTEFRVD